LSESLQSSGFVNPKLHLPKGLIMAEPLPRNIGINPDGCIEQEFWLRDESSEGLSQTEEVKVIMESVGSQTAIQGSTALSSATVICSETLQGRTFLIESAEMQLRQIALELRGKRPSPTELALLREKLMGVKESVRSVLEAASDPKSKIQGRCLLLTRLDDLEIRRNRLSYTLGHFEVEKGGDARSIGAVGIDAVLRDASQKVPLSNTAREWLRIVDASNAILPMKKELSTYGKSSTFDSISGCDAKMTMPLGNAMFYRLHGESFSTLVDCSDEPIAYEVFSMLSGSGKKAVAMNGGESFTRVGIPMYVTPEHFRCVQLFLPAVMDQLSDNGAPKHSPPEKLFLELLGRSLASSLRGSGLNSSSSGTNRHNLTLLQKTRSVRAILDSKIKDGSKSLLDELIKSAETFINDPESRIHVTNIYEMASIGLLVAENWPSHCIVQLGEAIIEESMRRIIISKIQNKSESERIQLAWSVLGHSTSGTWLDFPLKDSNTKATQSCNEQFDMLAACDDLKYLEEKFPGVYSPRNVVTLVHILNSPSVPDGRMGLSECYALRSLYQKFTTLVEDARIDRGVWNLFDSLMLEEGDTTKQEEIVRKFGAAFVLEDTPQTLRDILAEPMKSLSQFAVHCLRGLSFFQNNKQNNEQISPRLELASVIDSIVTEREECARKYIIKDANYPSPGPMSAEQWAKNWGSEASPVDPILYAKVRSRVHRNNFNKSLTVKEALADKAYRKHGGHFAFPSQLDTFIPGLHRRTRDLHNIWKQIGKETRGPLARKNAVEEMLLRLRWDSRDKAAGTKLSKIVGVIWDGLENRPAGLPISSALWLHDISSDDDEIDYDSDNSRETSKEMEGKEIFVTEKCNSRIYEKGGDADEWSVITGG